MNYDLIVIGAGPAGEVGAIRGAQLGQKVALIEKREHLGGTCLNVGCIPTKSLLESAKIWTKLQHVESLGFSIGKPEYSWNQILKRKDDIVDAQRKGLLYLMKKNKIDVFQGEGCFLDTHHIQVGEHKLYGKHILITTGSKVRHLPFLKEDGETVYTSDSILFAKKVPSSLLVIGGGVIGMEFASLFGRFGTKVTVVEQASQILPQEDPGCVKELERHVTRYQNVSILTGAKVEKAQKLQASWQVSVLDKDGSLKTIESEWILVSIGRAPVTEGLHLEKAGIKLSPKGFIPVNREYQTQVFSIFAAGDVIDTPALAHTASAEAIHAVEVISGHHPLPIDYDTNPSAIYTYPEVASVGLSEEHIKEKGIPYRSVQFPFAPMAKAKIEEATEGFIKLFVGESYGEILGVHIVGAKATELIGEFVLGKVLETTIDDIGRAIHPHPTIAETIMEVAHSGVGGSIHL